MNKFIFHTTVNPLLQCFPLFSFLCIQYSKARHWKRYNLLLKMAHLLLHYCYIQDSSQLYIFIYKKQNKTKKKQREQEIE